MIKIVDSIMGSGKSTWAINFINSHPENRYIIVTEYLEEATRFQSSCPQLNFCQPDGTYSKMSDFMQLMHEGRNMAITHKLFTNLKVNEAVRRIIADYGYFLIIDETINVIESVKIEPSDIQMLIRDNHMHVKENGFVQWTDKGYSGVFDKLRVKAESETLILIDNTMLAWLFSDKTMRAFEQVFVLTYNFKGSEMRSFLEIYQMPYEIYHIENNDLVPGEQDLTEVKAKLSQLINIYSGTMNKIGDARGSLSSSWYKKNQHSKIALLNSARNFFEYVCRCNAGDALWTCFSEVLKPSKQKKEFTVRHYASSFESCNARATNKWRDRHCLAYLIDVYPNPIIARWFKRHGSCIDSDEYALNQMLQWIWRSAIRVGEEINIYIPSKRMRSLLETWLQDNRITFVA